MNENKASKSHRIIQWERVHSMALLYLTFFCNRPHWGVDCMKSAYRLGLFAMFGHRAHIRPIHRVIRLLQKYTKYEYDISISRSVPLYRMEK